MREFSIIQHGAGKNFLGALQTVIKGKETVKNIEKQIDTNNLFDGIYLPFHFNPNWYDRTDWNKELLECQSIWRKYLGNRYEKHRARKEIIDRLNVSYKGTFILDASLPGIPHYGVVCILDNVDQRIELNNLANYKKKDEFNRSVHEAEQTLIHSWENIIGKIGKY